MTIQLIRVNKRYSGEQSALHEVNLALEQGEMAFLTGHSGAGKSTLLRLIAGLEKPSSGQIIVNGVSVESFKRRQAALFRSQLGIIFQTPHLLRKYTVFDNVALPLQIQGMTPSVIARRVHAALDMVGLLKKEKMLPGTLSGGEQQRVGIARAVVHKPKLLLADEPTGNLDPVLSSEIMRLFSHLNQAGVGVLIATHDLALIASMRYRIVMLKKGRLH